MKRALLFIMLIINGLYSFGQITHAIKGNIIDKKTREPIPYTNVIIWNTTTGAQSDSLGNFILLKVKPGTYRLQVSSIGYNPYISSEFMVSSKDKFVTIELEENSKQLGEVTVKATPFRKTAESPIAMRVIGFTEIEKSAGANRDISRVIQSFPGVASSPAGYRNDLIVRGGGPAENRYYIDGVEIPNINHFATQGASGGPVGIINAELIRETDFYSGAFPAGKNNAMSSVLDFKLKDGSTEEHNYSFVLGSSDFGFNTDGHIGKKVTYIASIRQSYLQYLFKALNLPFLPTFTDAQFKTKIKFDKKNELTILGLGAIDNMTLNTDTVGQTDANKYIITTLPIIRQNTYTLGAVYKHFSGKQVQTLVLSTNRLFNENTKYKNNDESSPANKILDYCSSEQETKLRFENSSRMNSFRLIAGANAEVASYYNRTNQRLYVNNQSLLLKYATDLSIFKYGLFGSLSYEQPDGRFTASLGVRTDANSYSSEMNNPLKQLSPRLSLSYQLAQNLFINGNVGRYYQLPSYTVLGYKDNNGIVINRANRVKYIYSDQIVVGFEHQPANYIRLTLEGFYKKYENGLLSLADSIPLSSKGNDYNVLGTESVNSTAQGRAYGLELLARWFGYKNLNLIAAYTYVRSEFKNPKTGDYIPSAWDSRHLFTLTGGYTLPRNWVIGAKFRAVGGAPYTPYDVDKSSLKTAWDAQNRPYLDYSRYNTLRLKTFTQLDLRVDKTYFFNKWMFGFYFDVQNAMNTQYNPAPVITSTGITDPTNPDKYIMKTINQRNGTVVPSIGIMVEF
ncbi:TonB-dependent receptor [Parabacteroides sp. FAFU027]|uniref:TonB-dependent receptor n=1 Tax=Parabacteroides sp. FAFU027 TaxID=2922715 RepID=UPI001FAEF9F3|nr:TonB-dependent receptor [Parabacteroides sp. FAFU027]